MTCRALKEVVSDKTTSRCQNIYLCCLCPGVVLLHFGLPLLGGGSWINAEIGCGCLHGICISWRTFPGIIRSGILGCEPQAETLSHCQYRNQDYSPCELKLKRWGFFWTGAWKPLYSSVPLMVLIYTSSQIYLTLEPPLPTLFPWDPKRGRKHVTCEDLCQESYKC